MTKIDICHSGNSPTNATIESIALAMLTPWNIDNDVNTDDDNKKVKVALQSNVISFEVP